MQYKNFRQLSYRIRHRYMTLNNIVLVVALVIGASWAWSSITVMQRNYALQSQIETKQRQQRLLELQTNLLEFEQNYYRSTEYQELAAREYFSLADPGEKMLILPPYTEVTPDTDETGTPLAVEPQQPSNLQLWTNFLFGGNRQSLSEED